MSKLSILLNSNSPYLCQLQPPAAPMWAIFKKEFSGFFYSLTGYLVISVFLLLSGLFVWVFPQSAVPQTQQASLQPFFVIAPYICLFLVPAITMRSFAEEKRNGTFELLLTRPITEWQLLLGKYLAALAVGVLAVLPTLVYFYSVYQLGQPVGNIDTAAVAGSYIGLVLLIAGFTSIGVLASSLTQSQVVAFLLAAVFCFVLYEGIASVAALPALDALSYGLAQLGIDYHYRQVSRGLLDSRNLLYFLSLSIMMLTLTKAHP